MPTPPISRRLPAARRPRQILTLALAVTLAACGGDNAPTPAAPVAEASQEAVATAGDTTVRANVLRTSTLNAEVARSYGITRDNNHVLLLVAVRKGPLGPDISPKATIEASVTRLGGAPDPLALREQAVGDLVDHVATLAIKPPETLTFDLTVTTEGGSAMQMRFVRDFVPAD